MFCCDSSQKSNGFARSYDGPWKIGTQAGVDLVTELDKAWSNKDFEKMKMFFDDSATFLFAEGDRFNSIDGFIDHIKNQMGDDDANWTYDWAVAVDESPGEGGEWVNAGSLQIFLKQIKIQVKYIIANGTTLKMEESNCGTKLEGLF